MASQMKQIKAVKHAIKTKNIAQLKTLAVKHGFLSDKLRKKAWPLLLGVNNHKYDDSITRVKNSTIDVIEHHQIEQDIKRTPVDYYNIKTKPDEDKCRASLSKILHAIFDANDDMHYIQGFNDVTSVLFAVCNKTKLAHKLSKKLAETLMNEFIGDQELNFSSCNFIIELIDSHDKQLSNILRDEQHDFIAISISWLITWFSHQISDINLISRIYDYCLCSSAQEMVSSYLSAAVLLYLKHDIFRAKQNEMKLFEYFHELEWNQIDFNAIIAMAELLLHQNTQAMNDSYSYLSDSSDTPSITNTPSTAYSTEALRMPSTFDLLNVV